jgi:hypothetical protein
MLLALPAEPWISIPYRTLNAPLVNYLQGRDHQSCAEAGLLLKLPACLIAAVAVRLVLPLVTGKTAGFKPFRKTGARLASRIGARPKGRPRLKDA